MVYGQPDYTSILYDTSRLSEPSGLFLESTGALWIADTQHDRVVRYDQASTKPVGAAFNLVLLQPAGLVGKLVSSGIAIDPLTGKVFVAESVNNRVLRFPSYDALATGSQPEAVLGQPNFISSAGGDAADQLRLPAGLVCTPGGRLWVADAGNHRVLRFDNAAVLPNGASSSVVLGQPDFGISNIGLNASRMYEPRALALDPAGGALWVGDTGNHRVLRFDAPHLKPNGAAADGVLGQISFLGDSAQTTDRFMSSPAALTFEKGGRLWVLDAGNNRVLRFDNAASKPNWSPADGVLGQPDFLVKPPGKVPLSLLRQVAV